MGAMKLNPVSRPWSKAAASTVALGNGRSFEGENSQTHLEANQMTSQRKLCSTSSQNSAICARKGNIILMINIGSSGRMCNKAKSLY